MELIRQHLKELNLNTVLESETYCVNDQVSFKNDILDGFEKIISLNEFYKNRPAIILAHGPSLLEIDKEKYKDFIKITCNDYHKIPNFFDDSFKPDFWVGANSYEAVHDSVERVMKDKAKCIITIPKKSEFELFLKKFSDNSELIYPWLWERRILQLIIASKYNVDTIYTHCNTITNHMIAFAMLLGCNPIHVTGFDLNYEKALEETGNTHAGYTIEETKNNKNSESLYAFSDPELRKQIMYDLNYLCEIARKNKIEIHNLSSVNNKLPYNLGFE